MGDTGVIRVIRKCDETAIGEVITKYSRLLWSVAGGWSGFFVWHM